MNIIESMNSITAMRAINVQLGAHRYTVDWDGEDESCPEAAKVGPGVLTIYGVATNDQLDEILRLARGVVAKGATAPPNAAVVTVVEVKGNTQHVTVDVPPGETWDEPAPTPAPAPATPVGVDDLSAFGRMNLLGEIVTEIQARGAKNYAQVWAYIIKLRDTESCPAIEKLEKEGKLEERVKRQCVGKGIEGAL